MAAIKAMGAGGSANRELPIAGFKVGLIGQSIKKSLSPALHETEGEALGIGYSYRLFDLDDHVDGVDALPAIIEQMESEGFAGSNITHPIKQRVMPLLDRLSPEAASMGAVNTVRFAPDGAREGHNTDWWGFAENLKRTLVHPRVERVVLLGAGGVGAAAGYAMGQMGAGRIEIIDADAARAAALADRLLAQGYSANALPLDALEQALAAADGLIHATPTGMVNYPGLPVPAASLHPGLWVSEIVYVPLETELLRVAREHGCPTADDGGMVVLQASKALEIFTGLRADADRMMHHFARLVG